MRARTSSKTALVALRQEVYFFWSIQNGLKRIVR